MLLTIQIIAILQGLFVLFVLFINRKDYKKTTFWLLFGSLISVLFYILGDDGNNLFVKGSDWFLFDNSLFITFLFLFFKYYKSGEESFSTRDYLFFIPNILYFMVEGIEILLGKEPYLIEIIELLTELTFIVYLSVIIYWVFAMKRKHWIIYFAIPITLLFALSSLNDLLKAAGLSELPMFKNQDFQSLLLVVVAFLFYFIAFKLLGKKNDILPKMESSKYKNSNLTPPLIAKYKSDLIRAMEEDKLYLNAKLSIHDVSEILTIPRQYISEILNEHMHISFQDFINQYRVEEFINRIKNGQNDHFTLLAIATEVGFNSKSSFNAIFKKHTGLTPSEFKKNLPQNR